MTDPHSALPDTVKIWICVALAVLGVAVMLVAFWTFKTPRTKRRERFRDGWGQLPGFTELNSDDRKWLGSHFDLSNAWKWIR